MRRRWWVSSQCCSRLTSRSAEVKWLRPCGTVKYSLKRSAAVFVWETTRVAIATMVTISAAANEVHERDRDAAPDPDRAQGEHQRVEQQRDQRRDHEEEHRVSRGAREQPDEHEQQRKTDQLQPAGDHDPRRALEPRRRAGGSAHPSDRTSAPGPWPRPHRPPGVVTRRGAGSARLPRRDPRVRRSRLNRRRGSATVTAGCRRRSPTRRELHRRRQRQYVRRRRIALLVVLAAVTGGTLLVTAFGGAAAPTAPFAARRAPHGCCRPGHPCRRRSPTSARSRSSYRSTRRV